MRHSSRRAVCSAGQPTRSGPISFVLVYTLILLVPLTLAIALRYLIVVPRRECIQCDRDVAVSALRCRHCGYRYTFEDREMMKVVAEARQTQPDAPRERLLGGRSE